MVEWAEIKLISVFQEESAIQAKAWIVDYLCLCTVELRGFTEFVQGVNEPMATF